MIYEIVGWTGTLMILLAYFLDSTGKMSHSSRNYRLLNLFGALGIAANAVVHGAIPPAGLNIVWALIAIVGLVRAGR